ncbi:hypothetical protein BDV96DRAFT_574456 [Lophiotrema nucula]|uniref:Uncharacterized protein n=1 Tax=Lophiotrema nucula TaxID=690887 RepID=A0A6A5Z8K2_9PLEO|nr:hypothetical protein BDV96DRAFT_574456 [Lophiotrema nucula]
MRPDIAAQYLLTNALLDAVQVLSSTPGNDSVVMNYIDGGSSQLWYFTEGSTEDNFRLHTVDKGNEYALGVFNLSDGSDYALLFDGIEDDQNDDAQYWTIDYRDDGTVRLNNEFAGSNIYLDVVKDSLQVQMAGDDSDGQNWILSQYAGSIVKPTATTTDFSTSTTSSTISSTSISTTPSTLLTTTTIPSRTSTTPFHSSLASDSATPSATPTSTGGGGLAVGAKAGIGAGVGVVALAALLVVSRYLYKRHQDKKKLAAYQARPVDPTPRLGNYK